VKVGDVVRFHDSSRRNGKLAGQYGLIVDMDAYNHPVVNVAGTVKAYHRTQIEKVIGDNQ
jgi:hypothetical protein